MTKQRKGWKATRRTPQPLRGGDETAPLNLPRSLGLTLESIRRSLDLSLPQMLDELCSVPRELSQWPLPKLKEDAKNPGGMVAHWENAKHDPEFAFLHRYGVVSETLAGAFLFASHFYAHLRDAAHSKKGTDKELADLRTLARKLHALADRAELLAATFEDRGYRLTLSKSTEGGEDRAAHLDVIRELLDGYREGPLKPRP